MQIYSSHGDLICLALMESNYIHLNRNAVVTGRGEHREHREHPVQSHLPSPFDPDLPIWGTNISRPKVNSTWTILRWRGLCIVPCATMNPWPTRRIDGCPFRIPNSRAWVIVKSFFESLNHDNRPFICSCCTIAYIMTRADFVKVWL